MPPVRTLVTPAQVTAPVTAPAAAAPEPQSSALLPSWATSAPMVPEDTLRGPSAPYVGQLQPNTGKRQALVAAGCNDGDFYLSENDVFTPLKPLRYWLLKAAAFRTTMDAAGNLTSASRDLHNKQAGDEHIVTLLIVDVGGRLVPAKADFRKAQWQAANTGIEAVKLASSPDFPSKGDAFRVAAQFPAPFARMSVTVSVQKKISRTSGKPYFVASGTPAPSSVSDLQRLAELMKDDSFIEAANNAEKSYQYRVDAIAKLCK